MSKNIIPNSSMQALIEGDHRDPFSVLGMHREGGRLVVRALIPGAWQVAVIESATGNPLLALPRVKDSALFEGYIEGRREPFAYRLRINWGDHEQDLEDAYRFFYVLGDIDVWLLAEGTHHRPYEKMGAHPREFDGVQGVTFAVWAPNARRVSVVGSFNDWDGRRHMMRYRVECGVWEIFIPHLMPGDLYKYEIKTAGGDILLKSDPFAFRAEMRPDTASIIHWLPEVYPSREDRQKANALNAPVSVYEVHLGSWRKEEGWRWLTYRELYDSVENIWSVLFTTGYLTMRGKPEGRKFHLAIPNTEIRNIFVSQIAEWFQRTARQDGEALNAFCEAFQLGDAAA